MWDVLAKAWNCMALTCLAAVAVALAGIQQACDRPPAAKDAHGVRRPVAKCPQAVAVVHQCLDFGAAPRAGLAFGGTQGGQQLGSGTGRGVDLGPRHRGGGPAGGLEMQVSPLRASRGQTVIPNRWQCQRKCVGAPPLDPGGFFRCILPVG